MPLISVTNASDLKKVKDGIILFYAPWCPHCRHFLPEFQKLQQILPFNQNAYTVDLTSPNNNKPDNEISDGPIQTIPKVVLRINGVSKAFTGNEEERTAKNIAQQFLNGLKYNSSNYLNSDILDLEGGANPTLISLTSSANSYLDKFWKDNPLKLKECISKYGYDPTKINEKLNYWHYGIKEPEHGPARKAMTKKNQINIAAARIWANEELGVKNNLKRYGGRSPKTKKNDNKSPRKKNSKRKHLD